MEEEGRSGQVRIRGVRFRTGSQIGIGGAAGAQQLPISAIDHPEAVADQPQRCVAEGGVLPVCRIDQPATEQRQCKFEIGCPFPAPVQRAQHLRQATPLRLRQPRVEYTASALASQEALDRAQSIARHAVERNDGCQRAIESAVTKKCELGAARDTGMQTIRTAPRRYEMDIDPNCGMCDQTDWRWHHVDDAGIDLGRPENRLLAGGLIRPGRES